LYRSADGSTEINKLWGRICEHQRQNPKINQQHFKLMKLLVSKIATKNISLADVKKHFAQTNEELPEIQSIANDDQSKSVSESVKFVEAQVQKQPHKTQLCTDSIASVLHKSSEENKKQKILELLGNEDMKIYVLICNNLDLI
jgi:hypothetical protein